LGDEAFPVVDLLEEKQTLNPKHEILNKLKISRGARDSKSHFKVKGFDFWLVYDFEPLPF